MSDGQKKPSGRPFKKGNPGGPGRPRGRRDNATLAAEQLLDGETEQLTRKAIELAKEGDTTALRLCLERICPPRKDRPVAFEAPAMKKPEDAVHVMGALLQAVASGDITPTEAQTVSGIVENFRRTLESEDLARRLEALEKQQE